MYECLWLCGLQHTRLPYPSSSPGVYSISCPLNNRTWPRDSGKGRQPKGTYQSVQSLSHVWLFVIPWTVAHVTSLSFTIFTSLFKFMSIESAMLSNHLILCHPLLLLPSILSSIRVFFNELALHIRCSIETSASVLPMNFQGWFSLRLTGLISMQYKGLSRVFSSTTIWKHQFFGAQPSLWSSSHICTWLLDTWRNFLEKKIY